MATLFEYYNTGDDAADAIPASGTAEYHQTFTPQVTFLITELKVKLYRIGTSVYYVQSRLWGFDGDGNPWVELVGADGFRQVAFKNITTDSAGAWYTFTLTTPYLLATGTEYTIEISQGGSVNKVYWKYDSADSTYTRGDRLLGVDYIYTRYPGTDYMFETWGNSVVTTNAATNVTSSSALLNGTTTSTFDSLGFYYSTDSSVSNYKTISATGTTGDFSASISGLSPSIVYYFKAGGALSGVYTWGSILNFTTSALSPVLDSNPFPAGFLWVEGTKLRLNTVD